MIIHKRIEEQTARTPDAVALVVQDHTISYDALNRAANRMAWSLLDRGVQREQFVGVRLERSAEAVIALLGILKAGAAWIYLDPDLPQARVEAIMLDAKPQIVIARGDVGFGDGPTRNLGIPVAPDCAACVLYTSGSTGSPKGAIEIHRSLTARLESGQLPDILPGDICVLNSSLAFGVTASRFLLPLSLGAQLVIPPESDVKDVLRFADTIASHGVTSLFLPPVLLRTLLSLDALVLARLSAVRAVSVTGSSVSPELALAFFRAFPNAILVNLYGSTEIGSTAALRVMTGAADSEVISIGRPVPAASMYLLDDSMQPVLDGETGELYVGVPYLAREYLNQPERTAERFLPDPFVPGRRIYKTGDLARRLANGEIQLAGRRDHQVKIRGHRVELEEIEASLERHPDVAEAAVRLDGEMLIAYVVPATELSAGTLRTYARAQLPQPMNPAGYLFLAKLPRTSGGKVDRMSLPPYDPARPELDTPFEAPRGAAEIQLAQIWADALKIRQVGIHDNFLDLGGDSLAALRVIVQVEQRFGHKLTMETLFDLTVARIAASVNR